MKIWKFSFETQNYIQIVMPAGAQSLTVQTQGNTPCLWALVDENNPPVVRIFRIYGTGHAIPGEVGAYVGTYQLDGGALVFHMFEIMP